MIQLTLKSLIKNLQKNIKANNTAKIDSLKSEIYRKLILKHDRFKKYNSIHDLLPLAKQIENDPYQIETYLKNSNFTILQKRDIDILNHFGKPNQSLYSKKYINSHLNEKRFPAKIIFTNPYIQESKSLQSWAKPKSISRSYGEHLYSSKNSNKSKFLKNIDFEKMEYKVFDKGYGILDSSTRIYLYGLYNKDIGTLSNSSERTKYLKMQVDRVNRNKGRGYCCELHSYPISLAEIERDFSLNKNMIDKIKDTSFKVYN